MATRRTKAVEKTEENFSQDVLEKAVALLSDDTFSGETLTPALETMFNEMGIAEGNEATVHVSKLDADSRGTEANIWRGSPDDYDLERLAKQFGSGSYRVKVYVRIPQGSKVLKANKVFTWMLSPEDEKARLALLKGEAVAPQSGVTLADVARIVAEAINGIKQVIPQPSPQPDPLDQMTKLAGVMRMMMPEVPAQAAQPQGNMLGQLKDMAELMQMLRGDDDGGSARGANGNDLMLAAINKFAPLLGSVLTQPGAAGMTSASTVAPQAMIPSDVQAQPAPAVQQAQPQEDDDMLKLKMGLAFLIGQCEGGGHPETYAEVVLDSVPPEAIQQLLTTPDPIAYLTQINPKIGTEPYRAWFTTLLNECREMLKEEQPAEGQQNAPV